MTTPNTPTPKQALENLLMAARNAPLTYVQHATIDQCYAVLSEVVNNYNSKPAKEKVKGE